MCGERERVCVCANISGALQFEHALRRLFIDANDLPQQMMYCSSSVYYTTLDMFMAKALQVSDKEMHQTDHHDRTPTSTTHNNRMIDRLGESLLDVMHDLFVYVAGPRVRDRVCASVPL
jgi:hypothetical protein